MFELFPLYRLVYVSHIFVCTIILHFEDPSAILQTGILFCDVLSASKWQGFFVRFDVLLRSINSFCAIYYSIYASCCLIIKLNIHFFPFRRFSFAFFHFPPHLSFYYLLIIGGLVVCKLFKTMFNVNANLNIMMSMRSFFGIAGKNVSSKAINCCGSDFNVLR